MEIDDEPRLAESEVAPINSEGLACKAVSAVGGNEIACGDLSGPVRIVCVADRELDMIRKLDDANRFPAQIDRDGRRRFHNVVQRILEVGLENEVVRSPP